MHTPSLVTCLSHTRVMVCFHQTFSKLDSGLTYMDWTWDVTGIDFTYIWDPELWVKLKEAVAWGEPNFFWNALFDRIQYREWPRFGVLRPGGWPAAPRGGARRLALDGGLGVGVEMRVPHSSGGTA
jgi:hypothetical protein